MLGPALVQAQSIQEEQELLRSAFDWLTESEEPRRIAYPGTNTGVLASVGAVMLDPLEFVREAESAALSGSAWRLLPHHGCDLKIRPRIRLMYALDQIDQGQCIALNEVAC